ncbi:MAG: UDP-2,4-diacetamido-2,4,6-trideoxy-beta-L-altropyranose hydrolase [Rhodospirillaceae bacterium]|nr:UDP-2,4-diacetamido-2,4,6-trideoxy-beta-L-altropyranose hydrolase [Rhodospirillaceae bacterium]
MTQRHARFRFDASSSIGCGHAYRCLALGKRLQEAGWAIDLATTPETADIINLSGFRVISVSAPSDAEATEIGTVGGAVDLLVVDHYGRDAKFETACRGWAKQIMVIDDLANRPHDCDILLDQNLGRSAADYTGLVPPGCKLLIGPDFALLRPQFAQSRFFGAMGAHNTLNRIVVSLGGTDPHELTGRVLHSIHRTGLNCDVDVVTGANASPIEMPSPQFRAHRNVTDMAQLLANADLVIGAGGTSSWERCCLGLPTALVVTADNQRAIAATLFAHGTATSLGDWTNLSEDGVADTLIALASNPRSLTDMRNKAGQICDGLGLDRVLGAIKPQTLDTGEVVHLRKVQDTDCDTLLAWQQEPGARAYMRNPTPPQEDEHQNWFRTTRNTPRISLNIIMVNGQPCGVVRADADPTSQTFEISILVSSATQSRGVGTAALILISQLIPWATLIAEIHPDNVRSRIAFERAGFAPYGPGLYRHDAKGSLGDVPSC